ncbi:thermonuclease family protein [Bradyrhizobium japonicum]|uniref:thermonuclease family protein n=1 Tax=Bradyrhizobium japonicum TaxID=375 RepID=UPI003B589868
MKPAQTCAIFLWLAVGCPTMASAGELTGRASIIDGDTLEIHGSRIRLWGIDAPESDQLCRGDDSLQYRCGAKAASELDRFINSRPVTCVPIDIDRYGRTVGVMLGRGRRSCRVACLAGACVRLAALLKG